MNKKKIIKAYISKENKDLYDVFVYKNWYVVKGSVCVSYTYEELKNKCNLSVINNIDTFTVQNPINSISELMEVIDE